MTEAKFDSQAWFNGVDKYNEANTLRIYCKACKSVVGRNNGVFIGQSIARHIVSQGHQAWMYHYRIKGSIGEEKMMYKQAHKDLHNVLVIKPGHGVCDEKDDIAITQDECDQLWLGDYDIEGSDDYTPLEVYQANASRDYNKLKSLFVKNKVACMAIGTLFFCGCDLFSSRRNAK